MAKLLCSLVLICSAFSMSHGQTCAQKKNPMKQALIYEQPHSSYSNRHMGDYVNPQFTNDATGYQRYVNYIVTSYNAQYNLNKMQEAELQLALTVLYNSKGVMTGKVHDLIADKLKEMLGFKQYLEWGESETFPEYTYFSDWNRLDIRYISN